MNIEKFKAILRKKEIPFSEVDGKITISHAGHVYLSAITSLPEGVKFTNIGDVYLDYLKSLPEGTKFKNIGNVNLNALTSLPEGTKFTNIGNVYLRSLEFEDLVYRGQKIRIKTIDGYTMVLLQSRKAGDVTIYKSRYFGGGEIDKLKESFLANQGEHWSHGKTSREAVEDLRFKVMAENFDKDDVLNEIKDTQRVHVHHYRLLTGACSEGCRHFLRNNGYEEDTDSLPLPEVVRLISGQYGSDIALPKLKLLLKGVKG